MKEIFTLEKVIDPHKHMPEEIKDAFFKGHEFWDLGNNSYMPWIVGSIKNPSEDFPEDLFRKQVDDWLLEHLTAGERVLILYWW